MANSNKPFGFRPVKYADGSPYNGAANLYMIPSADTDDYYIGKLVKLAGTADANGVPTVTKATSTAACIGPIVAVLESTPNNPSQVGGALALELKHVPGTKSKDYYVLVADAANLLFEVQEDSTGGALAATSTSLNANFAEVDPSNTQQLDASVIDSSSANTTNSLDLQLMRLAPITGNVIGNYAIWLVRLNLHQYANGRTGV